MNFTLPLLVIAACMAGAAFFSGIETGVISIHRLRLQHFVRQGSRPAMILQRFLDNPDLLLGTTLAGTNLCIVIVSVVATGVALHLWGLWGEAASSVAVTAVILVFCEYLPKAWFHSQPFERCARFALLLRFAERALKPLSAPIVWLTRWLIPGPSGSFLKADALLTRDELKILTQQGEKDGILTSTEGAMIHGVFGLSSKRAGDIMVPRERMTVIQNDTTLPEFYRIARAARFTRMPVFDRARNCFAGIVNLFAVVSGAPESRQSTVSGFVRPPLLIPERMRADEILPRMRRSRQPMCLVTNSANEVIGLVTIEDILKEIVGKL